MRGRTGSLSGACAPALIAQRKRFGAGILLGLLALLTLGCSDRTPQVPARPAADSAQPQAEVPVPEFSPPSFEEGRTLDTIVSVSGGRVVAVASIQRDSTTPSFARADRIELFAWDGSRKEFISIRQHDFHWVRSYHLFAPGAGRSSPVLLVYTDGGGNDPIASRGAAILTLRAPAPSPLTLPHGTPQSIAAGDSLVLLARSRFIPPLAPLHGGYEYVASIVMLEGDTLHDVRSEACAAIVQGQYKSALEAYQRAMKTYGDYRYRPPLVMQDSAMGDSAMAETIGGAPAEPSPLTLPAATVLIALDRANEVEGGKTFWERERKKLRTMVSPAELEALDSLARPFRPR